MKPNEISPTWDGTSWRWRRPLGRCTRTGCQEPGIVAIKWRAYAVGDWMCPAHAREYRAKYRWLIA